MIVSDLHATPAVPPRPIARPGPPAGDGRPIGHAHFWQRALARRRFIQVSAAGATGVLLGAGVGLPGAAEAKPHKKQPADPRPIPGGITIPGLGLFHIFLPGSGAEPSTITDFNGFVGITEVSGMGTQRDAAGKTGRFPFDADMRFMQGEFVGLDGKHHHGTFAFI